MEQLNAINFLKKLKESLLIKEEQAKAVYHSNTAWTNFIKKTTEEMIGIQENGKKSVSNEYYRIDTLKFAYTDFYNTFKEKNYKQSFGDKDYLNVYNWKNVYAIEYENDSHSWTDELIKLSHIRSDLKVIIAYSEWLGGQEEYLKLIEEKISFAKVLLKNCQEESLKDKWLIVFGPCKAKGKEEYDKDIFGNFVGYEMEKGEFVKIED